VANIITDSVNDINISGKRGEKKMSIIEVKNLNKEFKIKEKEKGIKGSIKSIVKPKYKEINAVDNISFSVEKGEILAFIGPNGAGKSTTIKMLTGILYPTSGNIEVMGLNPSKQRKQLAYKIGTVFGQKEQLWMHLTPYDNFKFFGAIYDIPDSFVEKRIEELKITFELETFINTPVKNLSLGQRIRCEIAAALIHKPEILFLDEPTIGLDPVVKETIRTLIKRMNKEYKTTIFLTSHDVGDIEKLCKRVIIINNGKIIMDDTMENFIRALESSDSLKGVGEVLRSYNAGEKYEFVKELISPHLNGMFVTPKDVDEMVHHISHTLSEAINMLFSAGSGRSEA